MATFVGVDSTLNDSDTGSIFYSFMDLVFDFVMYLILGFIIDPTMGSFRGPTMGLTGTIVLSLWLWSMIGLLSIMGLGSI